MNRRIALVLAALMALPCTTGRTETQTLEAQPDGRIIARLLTELQKSPQTSADAELERKLIIARTSLRLGKTEHAGALLAELQSPIADLPRTLDDSGKINGTRLALRSGWLIAMVQLDSATAMASAEGYRDESNNIYLAGLVEKLIAAVDCDQPGVRTGLTQHAETMLSAARQDVEQKLNTAMWAPSAIRTATAVALHCGSTELLAAAAKLSKSAQQMFEQTSLHSLVCFAVSARYRVEFAMGGGKALQQFAKYKVTPRNKFEKTDNCAGEKLLLASELIGEGRVSPENSTFQYLLKQAFEQLNDHSFRSCKLFGALPNLASLDSATVESTAKRALANWREAERYLYCNTLSRSGETASKLADAGESPNWMCSLPSDSPRAKLREREAASLKRDQQLAAAVVFPHCLEEAKAALSDMDMSDTKAVAAVRAKLLDTAPEEGRSLVETDLMAMPAERRYEYAFQVLSLLLR